MCAVTLTLSACGSFGKAQQTPTPRSEAVCDRSPPSPVPEIPATHPELEAAHRMLLALYHAEIIKYLDERRCRLRVREENAR